MTRIAYFDCPTGIAGDMLLGALVDLGVSPDAIEEGLRALPISGWRLRLDPAGGDPRVGGVALRVELLDGEGRGGDWGGDGRGHGHQAHGHEHEHGHEHGHEHEHEQEGEGGWLGGHGAHPGQPYRTFRDIRGLLAGSPLPASVVARATDVFSRLAVAEGAVHGLPADEVPFHEVGAVDSIVDVVGSVLALHFLGVDEVHCSPLPLGEGFVDCAHGRIPVPVPATLRLLMGVPVGPAPPGVRGELVTPTGAALAVGLASAFGPPPEMTLRAVGTGLGGRRLGPVPNAVRVLLGERREGNPGDERVFILSANIDDMSPQLLGPLIDVLLSQGALDAWIAPIHMKKGRPGSLLSALVAPDRRGAVTAAIFRETTTLGVRCAAATREVLPRALARVETPYGPVRVKLSGRAGAAWNRAPEFDDCLALARAAGVPVREVHRAAVVAADALDPEAALSAPAPPREGGDDRR